MLSQAAGANVVICVLDAARADRFGCYGYPRDTTPNTDRLAKESVVFRHHFATCPSTTPSTAALFTGLYPDAIRMGEEMTLAASVPTLPQAARAAGLSGCGRGRTPRGACRQALREGAAGTEGAGVRPVKPSQGLAGLP